MPITQSQLHQLLQGDEQECVEYKRELELKDPYQRSEFIKDFIALANAHGDQARYYLVGVNNDGSLHGFRANLDGADLNKIADVYIDSPVRFSCQRLSISGATILVVEIPRSEERFHVVKKDLTGPNHLQQEVALLQKGYSCIRKGPNRIPLCGNDYKRLREDFIARHALQPDIAVCLGDGSTEVRVNADWVGKPGPHSGSSPVQSLASSPGLFDTPIPPGTASIQIRISNSSTVAAQQVHVFISDIPSCKYSRDVASVMFGGLLKDMTKARLSIELFGIEVYIPNLLHQPPYTTETFYVTFPERAKWYDIPWTARAGNMTITRNGTLRVYVD